MGKHDDHEMHRNSLDAHDAIRENGSLGKRRQMIVDVMGVRRLPMTDRQVMRALRFTDPNAVRPRINELIKLGILEECGSVRDPESGRVVRQVKVCVRVPAQLEMQLTG